MKNMLISLLLLILGTVVGMTGFITPKISTANSAYSTAQAWDHLERISQEPRPNGSAFHQELGDFILQSLKDKQIHTQELLQESTDLRGNAITLRNIYADLELSEVASILFVAHYDSMPVSPGAGDNGMSVASILEAVTKISKDSNQKTNIKILFTDAEEIGRLGAKAFVEKNSDYLQDVIAVVNVEGFGNGPVMLVEGQKMAALYFKTANHPVAFSSVTAIPKDSLKFDTAPFLQKGFPSMTVATVTGSMNYHSPSDSFGNASFESQAHNLDTVYSMMDNLSKMDQGQIQELLSQKDKIFFNPAFGLGVQFPYAVGIILAVASLLLAILYCFRMRSTVGFEWKKVLVSSLGFLLLPILFYALVWVLLRLFSFLTWNSIIQLGFYKRGITWVSLSMILIALPLVYVYLKKLLAVAGPIAKLTVNILLGILGVVLSVLMPGIAYIVYIPLLVLLILKLIGSSVLEKLSIVLAAMFLSPLIFLAITVPGAQLATVLLISILILLLVGISKYEYTI